MPSSEGLRSLPVGGGTRDLVLIGNGPLEQQILAQCGELIRPSVCQTAAICSIRAIGSLLR